MTVGTYLLYGCEVNIYPVPNRFVDADEYISYLYDVLNDNDSLYRIVYEDNSAKFYLGFVVDQAHDTEEDVTYLNSVSFKDLSTKISVEVFESLEWLFLVYFNLDIQELDLNFHILTTYY